jgi:hypothetical protein
MAERAGDPVKKCQVFIDERELKVLALARDYAKHLKDKKPISAADAAHALVAAAGELET